MVQSADRAFVQRMEALDVEVRIVAPFTGGGVPHANKLRMFELNEREDFDVLLAADCDIAVVDDPARHLSADAISVVPADVDPYNDGQWRRIFGGLALQTPARSVTATTTGEPMYPYFNSGVIGVPRALCGDLLAAWVHALEDLNRLWQREPEMVSRHGRFYIDQLAMAIALARGLPWTLASRELNFPTHVELHGPTVRGLNPALLHYHEALDRQGFLLRPRCRTAERAVDLVNRSRAEALDLAYKGPRRQRVHGRAVSGPVRRIRERLR